MTPRVILLDRGHGGEDPGAVYGSIREVDLNTAVTKELYRLLDLDANYQPLLACPLEIQGRFTLDERARVAAGAKPDLLISNHFNAGGGTGFEVYPEVPRTADHPRFRLHQASLGFARLLAQEMEELLPLRGDKGVRYRYWNADSYYGIIRQVDCPSVLVENAFVDSAADMVKLNTAEALAGLARRQYRAICRHFGTPPLAPEDTQDAGGEQGLIWRVMAPLAAFDQADQAWQYARQNAPEGSIILASPK